MKQHYTSLPSEITESIKDGSILAGDNYTLDQIKIWFEQEQEAYYEADTGNGLSIDPWYEYMRLVNEKLGFSHIDKTKVDKGAILIIGPGPGVEIDQFHDQNPQWTLYFLEASENYKSDLKKKFPGSVIVDPTIEGDIKVADNSLNAICAFSVLHHIPNVSKIINESYRVLAPNGILLVREPCSSMGDWRYSRSATPNERGISRKLIMSMAQKAGFELVITPVPIIFEPINTFLKKTIGYSLVPNKLLYLFDRFISKLVSINDYYWRDKWYKKIGPSSFFYVFRKPNK